MLIGAVQSDSGDNMRQQLILMLTDSFPCAADEPFVESEILYWSHLPWAKVVVAPYDGHEIVRPVPADIDVCRSNRPGMACRLLSVFQAITSKIFWREIGYLRRNARLGAKTCKAAAHSAAVTLFVRRSLRRIAKEHGAIDLAYCYWNNEQSYAACLLRREGLVEHVISRAHGWDLYEDRRICEYMPLKRQFVGDYSALYSVSDAGRRYLGRTYGFSEERLETARLGVAVPERVAECSTDGIIRIVSVSFCVRVKRIDRIIEAIRFTACSDVGSIIQWTHIGGGELQGRLEHEAELQLGNLPNVRFHFTGALSHADVIDYFLSTPVDIFLNASDSEGVPVSIMEAMACGVPVIASAVGGIPELVDEECGMLIPRDAPGWAVADGVRRLNGPQRAYFRRQARKRIQEIYCSDRNFRAFVAEIGRRWFGENGGHEKEMGVRSRA